jgi:hypothetical protein
MICRTLRPAAAIAPAFALLLSVGSAAAQAPVRLTGTVIDADTRAALPCRLYIRSAEGKWHFAKSAAAGGSAVEYKKQRTDARSVEMHTTLTAGPFTADLPPGKYALTVEYGKEYFPLTRDVEIADKPVAVEFALKRWVDMAARGWYSGDTHIHRPLTELPNVQIAENLNVAFPLTYWVTEAFVPPGRGRKDPTVESAPAGPVAVDRTHVYWPRNTEYEIFTVDKKPHTLGAVFVLNHKAVPELAVPPVTPVNDAIRKDGALLELDKHNWPWSMAIIPLMNVDLFELSNNHVWRTEFAFTNWAEPPAAYMNCERDAKGATERGWIDYGFANYYALLDCGFRMRPTAGTASGVHPVPAGFGRVYVHTGENFSYDAWLAGLNAGRSFVTTGPMLFVTVNGQMPGHVFGKADAAATYRVVGSVLSEHPLERIDVVINGEVARTLRPLAKRTDAGALESAFDETFTPGGSGWIAVRCYEERPDKRVRFAHGAPVHIEVPGKPLRPRKEEIEFLMKRVQDQITRSTGTLPAAAIEEYKKALDIYRRISETAR